MKSHLLIFSFVICIEKITMQIISEFYQTWNLKKIDLNAYPHAKCLDGSPGGFWFLPGFDSGNRKYVIHLQGGGWCMNIDSCFKRSKTMLGSSNNWILQAISCCNGLSA